MQTLTSLQNILVHYILLVWQSINFLVTPVVALSVCLLLVYLAYHIVRLYVYIVQAKSEFTFLELQPLKRTELSPSTTEQLFTVLHGLVRQQPFVLKLLDVTKTYSFEIVSTKEGGITYLVRVPSEDAELVKKTLLSYLPGLNVKASSDYLDKLAKHKRVAFYKLSRHFAYPLKHQEALEQNDPIAYLTGSMTKLSDDDLIAFQVSISPVKKSHVPAISRISRLISTGKNLSSNIDAGKGGFASTVLLLILRILLLPVGLFVFVMSGGKEGPFMPLGSTDSHKTNNPYQNELEQLVKNKLDKPLFFASIRLLTSSNNHHELYTRERGFSSALASLSNAEYQSLTTFMRLRLAALQKLKLLLFKYRFQVPINQPILSTTELSDLYHLPYTSTTKTEDLTKQQSKELPAPLSLKQIGKLDLVFAENTYGGTTTPIGLSEDERRRHVYILGATGTGKSTILLSMIDQDLQHNKGLCLIDPHGDLSEQVLSIIPKNRFKDVVYFNPDDIGYPMGINLLELTPGLDGDAVVREKEFIAESIISVFHKIYTDKYSGPRMEYILRNTIHTAFTVPDATLFTIYKLLINTSFRKSVTKNLTDENLKDFWKYEFAKAGDYQKVKMISPITNKIGRFLFSPTAKRILEQPKSTISFDEIMNQGKILLCNLSKGKVGEDNSSVFGVLIMAKIQLAALKRARMKQEDRKDFYLYVDEFQNFATPAFAQILSEARKYRLNAILAHQTTSQIEENSLVNVTLANTGTVICFRTANPEDERVILPQFRPYVELGEINSLPSYHFYMRLGALNPQEPFSGITMPVHIEYSQNRVNEIIESSRKFFAKKYTGPLNSMHKEVKNKSEKQIARDIM